MALILVLSVTGYVVVRFNADNHTIGYRVVNLMYGWTTLEQLAYNNEQLSKIIAKEDFEHLNIDSEFRAINAYYKFKAEPAKIKVAYEREGLLLYYLTENENIDPEQLWYFSYDIKFGKVANIKEYKLVDRCDGVVGATP